MMQIAFLGAAGTVTGSRYLLRSGGRNILVDCGLFQGETFAGGANRAPFGFDPADLDAVVLTHAHLDHSGLIPRLVREGYTGPVYATAATVDLCRVLLYDSARIQQEDARGRRDERSRPLYTTGDVARALERFRPVSFDTPVQLAEGLSATFSPVAHILGAACCRIGDTKHGVLFSGDVGRPEDRLLKPPRPPLVAQTLVLESTYGDREHGGDDVEDELAAVIRKTVVDRRGVVVIPAFAVGRAQMILHLIRRALDRGRIPEVPVFLDSPMAIKATRIYCRHTELHRLTDDECEAMCDVASYLKTTSESRKLDGRGGPAIIIAGSGMVNGGRVLRHLQRLLPDERNCVVLVGFQARGTRGRALADGAQVTEIYGRSVPVRASIAQLHGLSAHADQSELLAWAGAMPVSPERIFLTHGEPAAAAALRDKITDLLGIPVSVPQRGETRTLGGTYG